MINFFDMATPYHSLKDAPNDIISNFSNPVLEIETKFQGTAPGPTEVAKKFDLIIDRDISLWVSTEIDSKLKREFKLVPGRKEGCRTWMIATISEDTLKDSVITHHFNSEHINKTNLIRTIWDLSYGESRLREVREKMLRMFIYES